MPKIASSCRGKKRKKKPTSTAPAKPKLAATWTDSFARSGWPAPRFCPATAAAAPISPTEVPVISGKRRVEETAEAAGRARRRAGEPGRRGRGGGGRADERHHEHAADVHGDALDAARQAEPEKRPDDGPVR